LTFLRPDLYGWAVPKKKQPARADYWARYYAENREREQLRKREWYLANREETIARVGANQREKAGGVTYRVGIKRRYLVAGGRVYFNSRLGFTPAELRRIAAEAARAEKC
jgi:hypothetical protein